MESQVTNNAIALQLFFTEDVFLVEDKTVELSSVASASAVLPNNNAVLLKEKDTILLHEGLEISNHVTSTEPKNYNQNAENIPIANETVLPKAFKFLGGNKKSVLILVNDSTNDVSSEQGRELLRKIVKAIDLSTPDFALVNYAGYGGTDFIELQKFFKPAVMLAFGVEAAHLKLNLTWSGEIILHQTTKIIFAPNLHPLDGDLAAKKSLWANLQKLK